MKYLKEYKEIKWEEDWEEEEPIDYEIVKYRYVDRFSYDGYRFHIRNNEKGVIILGITNKIILADHNYVSKYLKITTQEAEKISNDEIWLTNYYGDISNLFRKWKYSEIKDKINIINI